MPYFNQTFKAAPSAINFTQPTPIKELAETAMELTIELARREPENSFLVTARAVYRGNLFAAMHGDSEAYEQFYLLVQELERRI